ncbi:hypothetical protein [Allomuricauda sp. R78024]|uniref:hypothetical protein n=1 Tax=Allomuricauda sp. R78024 TaxID=3093867 RepID=UPI0037C50D03
MKAPWWSWGCVGPIQYWSDISNVSLERHAPLVPDGHPTVWTWKVHFLDITWPLLIFVLKNVGTSMDKER